MNVRLSVLFTAFLFVYTWSGLQAEEKATLAVLDFIGNNVSQADAAMLRNKIEVQFFQSGLVRVLERERFRKQVVDQNIGTMACSDSECAVRIARFIYADFVVIGSVDRVNGYTLNLRLVNATTGTIDEVITEEFSDRDEMFKVDASRPVRLLEPIKNGEYINGSQPVRKFYFSLSTATGYLLPLGDIRGKSENGLIISSFADFAIRNILFTLQVDYLALLGADGDMYASIVPVIGSTGYILHFSRFYFTPRIGGGFCYNRIHDNDSGIIEGLVFSKLTLGYTYSAMNFYTYTDYRYIVEKSGGIQFLSFGLGARFTF